MFERADSHMHFFHPGYVEKLPESCRRVSPDEFTLYSAQAKRAGIVQSLVIGFEGLPAYRGNNEYLCGLLRNAPAYHATAFVASPGSLTIEQLDRWRRDRFVGLSIYAMNDEIAAEVGAVPAECWEWISQHRWLVSVNSRDALWSIWLKILERNPHLRLLQANLGLPPTQSRPVAIPVAKTLMQHALALAQFPNVYSKVGALYAMTMPSYAFPHRAAWPYVEVASQCFGTGRLLWASDFSPSLEHVSFEQTCAIIDEMPFFSENDRRQIAGANLITLLRQVDRVFPADETIHWR